jgi:predicted nucleic acid-binding protein
MLLYLDANCFNRPFDDLTQDRVRAEADAVLAILQRIISGDDELAWSSALTLELSLHPEPEIRVQLQSWEGHAQVTATTTAGIQERVRVLAAGRLKVPDAAHIAFSESAGCDVFLTCDDRLLKRAQRMDLSLRVMNPVEYLTEVDHGGPDD